MYQNSYQPHTRFSLFPPVIKNVMIINVLVFMATIVPTNLGYALLNYGALWPLEGPFYPWQLLTYGFLHDVSGFGHIFFNMFALWMFGVEVENEWGSRRFGIYYFTCIIVAAIVQLIAVQVTGSMAPTVGASGGVMGILVAFGMMYPNRYIMLFPLPVPVKAKWFVTGYALIDLFAGIGGAATQVAHFAHLGGLACGFLLILFWQRQGIIRKGT